MAKRTAGRLLQPPTLEIKKATLEGLSAADTDYKEGGMMSRGRRRWRRLGVDDYNFGVGETIL